MEPTFDLPPTPSRKVLYGIAGTSVLILIIGTWAWARAQRAKPAKVVTDPILDTSDWKVSVKHLAEAFEFRLRNDEERLDQMAQLLAELQARLMTNAPPTPSGPAAPAATSMPAPGEMVAGQEIMSQINSNPDVGAVQGAPPVGAAVSM
jgi:hypothetical protein